MTYKARPANTANPTAIFHISFLQKISLIGVIFKWGQSNINFFNRRGIKPKGAERFLVPQYEEAPLGFIPLRLEINVALTPIKKKPSMKRA
jgi:hypothetical protein